MATVKTQPKPANPLAAFINTVEAADRTNVHGTLGDIRADWDTVELGKSSVHAGMFYVVLAKEDQRLSISFSRALSAAFAAGEVKESMLNSCEVAVQLNAAGEERLKLQMPAGSKRKDITGVAPVAFKRTISLTDIINAGQAIKLGA